MADDLRRDATDFSRHSDDDQELNRTRPDDPSRARIVPLSEVKGEFKVAEDDPDIRGWDVRSSDGQTIGKVNDLIVDTGQMKARYIEVKIDHEILGADDDRIVLLPIGEARLNDDEDDVYVNVDVAGLAALPEYDRSRFDRAYETSLRDRFTRDRATDDRTIPNATPDVAATTPSATAGGMGETINELAASNRVPDDAEFYDDAQYDERRMFGNRRPGRENESYIRLNQERLDIDKREVERGEARVRKTVDTEHVRRAVPVEREELVVERRPITGDTRVDDADISEDDIRVPLKGEELVIDKRVVPTEEVVIKKKIVRDEEVVEADLAHERLDVQDDATRRRPDDRDRI